MGETVQALANKADVPGRIKGTVADKKDALTDKMVGAKDKITGSASGVADTSGTIAGQAKTQAKRGAGIAQENPLGLAVASLAAGFVIGMLVPSTRMEDERIGPVAGLPGRHQELVAQRTDAALAQDRFEQHGAGLLADRGL